MLSEKTKSFIEKLAYNFQEAITYQSPNLYNVDSIINFVSSMGCEIVFNTGFNKFVFDNGAYKIQFESDLVTYKQTPSDTVRFLRVFFHEVWHFITKKINLDFEGYDDNAYTPESLSIKEATANYFSRAMVFPERIFVQCVINHTQSDGMCNIFEVAKHFNLPYSDVIARGNDLNLWNVKGGL